MKPTKHSISLVIQSPDRSRLLLVRRPDDDESLPGLWGLPAASLEPDESEEDAVRRAGQEKLGVRVEPIGLIGEATAEREAYVLVMRDYETEITEGESSVPQPFGGTQYVALRWGVPEELVPAARQGSLCSQVLLAERGIEW